MEVGEGGWGHGEGGRERISQADSTETWAEIKGWMINQLSHPDVPKTTFQAYLAQHSQLSTLIKPVTSASFLFTKNTHYGS